MTVVFVPLHFSHRAQARNRFTMYINHHNFTTPFGLIALPHCSLSLSLSSDSVILFSNKPINLLTLILLQHTHSGILLLFKRDTCVTFSLLLEQTYQQKRKSSTRCQRGNDVLKMMDVNQHKKIIQVSATRMSFSIKVGVYRDDQ